MMNTTQLPDRLQRLVDLGESGTDILHGELKNMMYETEQDLTPLLENSELLGSDEEYSDTVDRLILEGRMEALAEVYALTYQLAFAINERTAARG
jgi:hypothetical protein